MKLNPFFLFLILTQPLFAQYFTEKHQLIPFEGVAESSIAFADIDGDNDQDLLITGANSSNDRISKLYTNDGTGSFTEVMDTPFDPVINSSIAFADVDGDNDQDVFIMGANKSGTRISKLYTNDGTGNFTEMMDTPFEGVLESSIAFADVDGDNDQDLFITGVKTSGDLISKLYTNDGMGSFTEMMGTPFEYVDRSSIAFADIDGDSDQDVLITGLTRSLQSISKLYTNDGSGNFTVMTDTPFEGVSYSSVAFADVDGDNDQDVLITGYTNIPLLRISKLYTNDGTGVFTEMIGTPFEGVDNSSIAFADVDGDNDQDVLITGTASIPRISKLYINDGTESFKLMTGTPFERVSYSSIAFADVDGDNDQDVLITGAKSSATHISKLYTNDSLVTSSINELDVSLNLTPYPNPTRLNNLNISLTSMDSNVVTIRVHDLNGHLISQHKKFKETGEQTFVIDITSLTAGTYLIQLETGKNISVAKFIVP